MGPAPDQSAGEAKPLAHEVTIFVAQRKAVLANASTHRIIGETVANLKRWRVHAGVTLPDQCRFIISSWESDDLPASDFVAGFKMMMRRNLLEHFDESDRSEPLVPVLWEWQKDFEVTALTSPELLELARERLANAPRELGLAATPSDWALRL